MAKVTRRNNYRVEVVPRMTGSLGDSERAEFCEETALAIKDIVSDIQTAIATCDTEDVCSFCGEPWEVGVDGVTPECCRAAMAEFEGDGP